MPTQKKIKKTSDKAAIFEKSNEELVRHIKLSEHTRLTISVFAIDGKAGRDVQFNIRKFYRTQNDPTWKPARQGITLPLQLMSKFRKRTKDIEEALEAIDIDDVPGLPEREDK